MWTIARAMSLESPRNTITLLKEQRSEISIVAFNVMPCKGNKGRTSTDFSMRTLANDTDSDNAGVDEGYT